MKTVSFQNYMKRNLSNYAKTYKNGSLRSSFLVKASKSDERMSEMTYLYFLLTNNKSLDKVTAQAKVKYSSVQKLLESKNKYVVQYMKQTNSKNNIKKLLRTQLMKKLKEGKYSYYWVSKFLKVNQSNVGCFFKKEELNKLSLEKLYALHNELNKK